MDKPEKHRVHKTQDEDKVKKHNTISLGHNNKQTNTNNVQNT